MDVVLVHINCKFIDYARNDNKTIWKKSISPFMTNLYTRRIANSQLNSFSLFCRNDSLHLVVFLSDHNTTKRWSDLFSYTILTKINRKERKREKKTRDKISLCWGRMSTMCICVIFLLLSQIWMKVNSVAFTHKYTWRMR